MSREIGRKHSGLYEEDITLLASDVANFDILEPRFWLSRDFVESRLVLSIKLSAFEERKGILVNVTPDCDFSDCPEDLRDQKVTFSLDEDEFFKGMYFDLHFEESPVDYMNKLMDMCARAFCKEIAFPRGYWVKSSTSTSPRKSKKYLWLNSEPFTIYYDT